MTVGKYVYLENSKIDTFNVVAFTIIYPPNDPPFPLSNNSSENNKAFINRYLLEPVPALPSISTKPLLLFTTFLYFGN